MVRLHPEQEEAFNRLARAYLDKLVAYNGEPRIRAENGLLGTPMKFEGALDAVHGAFVWLMGKGMKQPDDIAEFRRLLPLFEEPGGGMTLTGYCLCTTTLHDRAKKFLAEQARRRVEGWRKG